MKLRINTEYLAACSQTLATEARQLSQAVGSLNVSLSSSLAHYRTYSVPGSLKYCKVQGGSLSSVLSSYRKAINTYQSTIQELSSCVAYIADNMEDTEKRLARMDGESNADEGKTGLPVGGLVQSANAGEDGIDWQFDDLLKNIFTSFGTGGTMVYSLFQATTPAGLAKFLVNGSECVTEWKEIASSYSTMKKFRNGSAGAITAKKIFGLQSFAKKYKFVPSKASSAINRFTSNFSRSGAFVKGMTNPVTWITELIDRGIENYEEVTGGYKDHGTAVAEWISETAVAVTAGAAAFAAVGALLPAAPVVGVGLLAGAAVWGIDTLWANTLGKGKDEDGGNEGLIETAGETIVEIGKQGIQAFGDAITKTKSFFTNGFNVVASWAA